MAAKLTRKEIQQDRIRAVLEDVYRWLTRNTVFLGAAVAIFALIVVAGYGWRLYQESATSEQQARLGEALQVFHAPLEGEEESVEPGHEGHDHATNPHPSKYRFASAEERNQKALETLTALAEEDPDSRPGQLARYYRAITLERMGRSDEAETVLRELIADVELPEVSNLARHQLGAILVGQGKRQEAIEVWKQILDNPAPNFPRDQLLARLGQASEKAGQPEAALDYYRKLVAEFPSAPLTRDLERRIDYLEAVLELEAPEEAPPPEQPES